MEYAVISSLASENDCCVESWLSRSAGLQTAMAEALEEWNESFRPGSHRWAVDHAAEAGVAAHRMLPARYREKAANSDATRSIATATANEHGTQWEALWERATELYERAYSFGMLRNEVVHATRALDYGELVQLTRIFKAWSADASESDSPNEVEDPDASRFSRFRPSAYVVVGAAAGYLEASFWRPQAWLRDWSLSVLPTLLVGFDKDAVAELIRNVRREKAAERSSLPVIELAQLKNQLARLANAIVPHGPPALISELRSSPA
jgi:hypothetical protein